MKNKKIFTIFLISASLAIQMNSSSCNGSSGKTNEADSSQVQNSKQLAELYCSSCHQLATPDMLDKKTWKEHVLPAMAVRMGIGVWQGNQYYEEKNAKTDHPIAFDDWEK